MGVGQAEGMYVMATIRALREGKAFLNGPFAMFLVQCIFEMERESVESWQHEYLEIEWYHILYAEIVKGGMVDGEVVVHRR